MLSFDFLQLFCLLVLVFYVGKVKLQAREERNTSLNVEIVSVLSFKNFVVRKVEISFFVYT